MVTVKVKVVGPPVRGDGTWSPFMGVEIRGTDGACTERPAREAVWSIGSRHADGRRHDLGRLLAQGRPEGLSQGPCRQADERQS